MIDEKEMLEVCESGVLTKSVNAYFKEKCYKRSEIISTIKKLKKQNKLQEIKIPAGESVPARRLLVTLHFPNESR